MKLKNLKNIIYLALILIVAGCHTDTPTGIDGKKPEGMLLGVYAESDTITYNADSSKYYLNNGTEYGEFSKTIAGTELYKFKFEAKDNDEVYKVSLYAKNAESNNVYHIKDASEKGNNIYEAEITAEDFTKLSIVDPTTSYNFYAEISDDSENSASISNSPIGFGVLAGTPLEVLHNKLGVFTEIDGDKEVNFLEKKDMVTFIQFYGYACGACGEEARHMTEAISSGHVNTDKVYIATFGSGIPGLMTADYVKRDIKDANNLVQDCFFDDGQKVKDVISSLWGTPLGNDVLAVLPSGKLLRYDLNEGTFDEWFNTILSEHGK